MLQTIGVKDAVCFTRRLPQVPGIDWVWKYLPQVFAEGTTMWSIEWMNTISRSSLIIPETKGKATACWPLCMASSPASGGRSRGTWRLSASCHWRAPRPCQQIRCVNSLTKKLSKIACLMKLEIWVRARNKPFVFSRKKGRLTADTPTRETEHFLRPVHKRARKYQV